MAEGGCLQPHPQCFCLELGLMEAQKQHPAGKTRCRFMVLNGWSWWNGLKWMVLNGWYWGNHALAQLL